MASALPGCVASLRSSLASLEGSIETLEAGVGDFPRLARVLTTTRVCVSTCKASGKPFN